jgi:DNA-binding CsgD family transcriptional regulator
MINPFEQTPAEKEEYVLDMLERGYSYPQIMRECHVSPSTISSVKKKFFGDDASKNASQISKETQAIKLFNEGKKPIEVAIQLDIATDYVFQFYNNFQRLRNLEAFISSYEHVRGNIQPYLQLFDLMDGLGMTPEQVAQQVKYGNNLPYLESIHSSMMNSIWVLQSKRHFSESQLAYVWNQLKQYKTSLELYDNESQKMRNELMTLDSEINSRKTLLQNFDNDEGYVRIKDAAKKETKLLIQDNQISCAVTLSATLEAIRRYPDNQALISDIISSRNYSTSSNQQSLKSHAPQLLRLMENVQNEIAEQMSVIVSKSMMNTDILNDDPD